MDEIQAAREGSQPIRSRTGGSTFANPPIEESGGHKAWQLIDAAGCRGLVVGDAQVSEQHCTLLINRGAATAADLETLGETVRERVRASSGISLRRSEEHTSELQSLMRTSYAVFCLKKKNIYIRMTKAQNKN